MYQRLLKKFLKHRWIVLTTVTVIWLLAVFSVSGLQVDENIMKLLPDKDERISAYREIYEKFNPMNAVFIDLALTGNEGRQHLLITSADSIYAALDKSPFFDMIIYRWQFQDLQQALNVLSEYRSVLFTQQDSIEVQSKLNYSYIRDRIQQWKRMMMETPSPFLANQFVNDPLDFNNILQKKLSGSQTGNENITVHRGRLFNKSKNHILIIAQPKFKSTDTGNGRKLIEFLNTQIFQLEEKTNNQIDISYLSAHRFSIENANRIQSDIQRTVTLALIAIIILSLLIYSRPLLMILTLLPALFGSAISLGLIRWIDPAISAIIFGSGAMLIGITVDYGIHFLYHFDRSISTDETNLSITTIRRLFKPLLLSAGTTVTAFIALQFSDLPGYRQLSFFVVLGILGALVFVIFILPLLLKQSKKIKQPILSVQKIFPMLFGYIAKRRIIIFVIFALITIVAIPGFLKLKFDGNVQNLNAVSPAIQSDMHKIKNEYGNILSSTLLMVKGESIDKTLQINEFMHQKIICEFPNDQVELSCAVNTLLPSLQQQKENRDRWNKLFTKDKVIQLSKLLNTAAHEFGMKDGVFNRFIQDLNTTSEYLSYEKYEGTLLETILANVIQSDSSQTYILSNVQANSDQQMIALSQVIKSMGTSVVLYDGKAFVTQIVNLILSELERIGLIAFIFVLVFISFSIRKIKSILIIITPLLISVFWTFSILGWLAIKINIINSIISVFIFGLVIDYCIFLISSFESSAKTNQLNFTHTSGGAIVISALTTMIGLGALVFAGHPALHSLGLTALIGIGSGLLVVLFFIPAILLKNTMRKAS